MDWTTPFAEESLPSNHSCAPGGVGAETDNLLSSRAFTVLGSSILGLALAVGLPGNAYVVWAILRGTRPGCRNATCVLVANLAVADGATLLTTPFWICFLARGDWEFGRPACKALHYVCCLNMYASVFLIATMSLDRLLAVMRPLQASRLRRRAQLKRVLAGLWLLAAILALPAPYYREVRRAGTACRRLCEPEHRTAGDELFHYLMETTCGFLLPYGALLVSYGVVGARVRSLMWTESSASRRGRLGRLIGAVVAAFGLLWMPYHAVNLAQAWARASGGLGLRRRLQGLRPSVTALAFVSSGVNPALYAFSSLQLLRRSGPGFLAKVFEGTGAEGAARDRAVAAGGGGWARGSEPAPTQPLTGLQ